MNSSSAHDFVEYSDASLVKLYRAGDEDAAAVLITRYLPLIRSHASAFSKDSGESYEDLCQEGMIALLAAVRAYDSSYSAFPTFARLCVDRMMNTMIRAKGRKKRIPDKQITAFDSLDDNNLSDKLTASDSGDPELIIIQREALDRLKARVKQELTELENAVLTDYIGGSSYDEIAERLGITSKSVDNALQRIRRKLR